MRTLFSKSYKIKMERGRQRLDAAAGFFNLVAVLRGSADLVFPALRAPRHANQGMWEAHYFSGGGGWRAAVGQGRRTGGVESKVSSTVDEAEGLVCWSLARRASGRGHGVEGGQVVPRGQHTLHADVRCSRDVSA